MIPMKREPVDNSICKMNKYSFPPLRNNEK